MENNYRVIMNGVTIPNSMLKSNSYSSEQTRKVLKSYFTQDGVLHEDLSKRQRVVIKFSLREHEEVEHPAFIAALQNLVNVPVTYWDTVTASYKDAICKMKISPMGSKMNGNNALYGAVSISLEEY